MKSLFLIAVLAGCGTHKNPDPAPQVLDPLDDSGGCMFVQDYGLLKGEKLCQFGLVSKYADVTRRYCADKGGEFFPNFCPRPRVAQCVPKAAGDTPIFVLYDKDKTGAFLAECDARGGKSQVAET